MKEDFITKLEQVHQWELCGMSWHSDSYLLATGGADGQIHIHDVRNISTTKPLQTKKTLTHHKSTVKALQWCKGEFYPILASGGGKGDNTFTLWDGPYDAPKKSRDTLGQITGCVWSDNYKQIATFHGFGQGKGSINVWDTNGEFVAGTMMAHDDQIFASCMCQETEMVATISRDSVLKMWSIFPGTKPTSDLDRPEICR